MTTIHAVKSDETREQFGNCAVPVDHQRRARPPARMGAAASTCPTARARSPTSGATSGSARSTSWRRRGCACSASPTARSTRCRGEVTPEIERDLVLLGLIGILDPARPEAREAVKTARAAGIRPIMITGDHALTAQAIAHDLGIIEEGAKAVVGAEIEKMSDARAERSAQDAQRLRPRLAGAQAAAGQGAASAGRSRRHDRRRRQRRARAQAGGHRRGDGHHRHGSQQGRGRHGADRRQFRLDCRRRRGRAHDLRQHPQVRAVPAQLETSAKFW